MRVVKKRCFILNDSKTIKEVTTRNTLGYCVGNGTIKPDPERMKPLQKLPLLKNMNSLKRIRVMIAYYAKWISELLPGPLWHRVVAPMCQIELFDI